MSRPPTQEEMYAAWLQQQQQRQQQQQQPMAAQQQPQTPFTTPAPQQQQYQIYGQPQIQDPYFQGLAQPGLALRLIQSPAMAQLRQQLYDESMQQAQFIYQTTRQAIRAADLQAMAEYNQAMMFGQPPLQPAVAFSAVPARETPSALATAMPARPKTVEDEAAAAVRTEPPANVTHGNPSDMPNNPDPQSVQPQQRPTAINLNAIAGALPQQYQQPQYQPAQPQAAQPPPAYQPYTSQPFPGGYGPR